MPFYKLPFFRAVAGILGAFIVVGFLVALGFTQTQVGRDALKNSLETWFAESFEGQLTVGVVRGSLLWDLYLQDVRLFDATDSLVIHVKAITLRPRWLDLPGRAFNVRELTVTDFDLFARYQPDSTWNVSSFRPRSRRESASRAWEFESTRIVLQGGRIITKRQAGAPDMATSQTPFNATDLTIDSIDLEAQLKLQANERFLQIHNMSAELPDKGLRFNSVEAEVVHVDQWHINTFRLESGLSRIDLTGLEDSDERAVNFLVRECVLTPAFINAWMPAWPVRDTLSVTGTVGFAPRQVSFLDLNIQATHSHVVASGLVNNSTYEISVVDGHLDEVLIGQFVAETPDLPAIDSLSIDAAGTYALPRPSGQASFRLYSSSGAIAGTLSAERDTTWTYAAAVFMENLNPALVSSRLGGSVTGNATVAGSGWQSPSARVSIHLTHSAVSGFLLDSLNVEAQIEGQQLSGSGRGYSGGGQMEIEADVSWAGDDPLYQLNGRMYTLNLSDLWPEVQLETALNASWTLDGGGASVNTASGELGLQMDSSSAIWDSEPHTILPHSWTVVLERPRAHDFRLKVGGDVLALAADGTYEQAAAKAVGDVWATAIRAALERQSKKARSPVPPAEISVQPLQGQALARQAAGDALSLASMTQVTLAADWKIVNGEPLSFLPAFESGQSGSVFVRADADSLVLDMDITGVDYSADSFAARGAQLSIDAVAHLNAPLEESVILTSRVQADRITGIGPDWTEVESDLSLRDGKGQLKMSLAEATGAGTGAIAADLEMLNDRNRLSVSSASVNIGGEDWQILDTALVDFFANAAVLTPLVMESDAGESGEVQRLQISGALSSEPADTFKVSLDNLDLERLSGTLNLIRRPIGGSLDARLQWTGLGQPEVTGTVFADNLSLNNRVVGSLAIDSRLLPGREHMQVITTIRPPVNPSSELVYAENELTVDGLVILPGAGRAGQLDLRFDANRLDAGFLEEIIPVLGGVTGGIAGEGIITGPFNAPQFNIGLSWPDGSISIPDYNTTYQAAASFKLLQEGIRVDGLELNDPNGGSAQVGGWLRFNDFRFLSFDVVGRLDALQIIDVPTFTRDLAFYGDLSATGDVTLTGPVDEAFLRSDNLVTTPQSELLIPIREVDQVIDPGFIIYADTTRSIAEQILAVRAREHLLDRRPEGERDFGTGLDMDLNIFGPPGSSIQLVIDPLLGDVINGIGTARIQLQRQEGQMLMYGSFDLTGGDYLFTAGEVFVRRFLISEGIILWDGDPTNPSLDIQASYRTRASRSGLPDDVGGRINASLPLIVELHITGTLNAVQVGLNLAIDQRREAISDTPLLEGYLNQPDRAAEHATSVLLTNSFLLSAQGGSTDVLAGSAFNSVSSLVANQLNRYLGQVIPNADFTLGVQSDETAADLDVSAGIALRLLDERLVIRGLGVYRSLSAAEQTAQAQGLEGEFIVEMRLRPDVAVEVFYRRESDALSETLMTSETGLGVNYRAEFTSWKRLWQRIFGRDRTTASAENTERAQPQ